MPSRVIETIFISGLIVLVLLSMKSVNELSVLIAQFGAVAVAAVRILPSISNIANAMNTLVYQRLALENAYNNIVGAKLQIQEEEQNNLYDWEKIVEFKYEICVDHIKWTYGSELHYVLKNLSLSIKPGEAIGLIGESGAGKTTLADIILGLFEPQQGTIKIDNKDILIFIRAGIS